MKTRRITVLTIILEMFVIATMMSACEKKAIAVVVPDDPEPQTVAETEITNPDPEEDKISGGDNNVNVSEVEPEEPKEDLSILRTTEELAKKEKGLFLLRDGVFYNLQRSVKKETPGVMYLTGALQAGGGAFFWSNQSKESKLLSYGEVPVPVLREEDTVIIYSDETPKPLKLYPAEFGGCSLFIGEGPRFKDLETGKGCPLEEVLSFEIMDDSGRKYKITDLPEKGRSYTVSWYKGTEYVEVVTDVLCSVYQYDKASPVYELSAEVTKNGYARYDFSGVASGLYALYYEDMEFIVEIP